MELRPYIDGVLSCLSSLNNSSAGLLFAHFVKILGVLFGGKILRSEGVSCSPGWQ